MTKPDRCPDCGAERAAGICPRCLIRLGIDGPGADRSSRSLPGDPTGLAGGEPTSAGVLETLAASIGPVPRVLLRDTAPGEEPGPIVRPNGADEDSSIRYRIDTGGTPSPPNPVLSPGYMRMNHQTAKVET